MVGHRLLMKAEWDYTCHVCRTFRVVVGELGVDALNAIGRIASIIGTAISLVTLVIVARIRVALKRHSRHRHLGEIIDRVLKIPATKEVLPESTCRDVQFVIETALSYEFSKWWFLDQQGKKLSQEIREELQGTRRRDSIQNKLRLLRDEITVR
jgi:hypothetical protein